MGSAGHDLDRWMPLLVEAWRGLVRARPPRGMERGRREARGGPAGRRGARDGGRARSSGALLSEVELAEVARGVQRLSLGLTRDRALAGRRYLDDPALLGAYLLYYWPVSYLQARGVLSELGRPPGEVVDLGSGPAPVALAALDAGATRAVAADRSQDALAAAARLARDAGEPLATARWDPARPGHLAEVTGRRKVDTITLGHVLNELFAGPDAVARRAGLLLEAAGALRPGGSLVVVEPALRETSRALLAVRDAVVAQGLSVRAPCLFVGPCPALHRESDWCHAERAVVPPPLVAEIARAAGLRREAVKMSYLVLAPPGERVPAARPAAGRLLRIVSEPLPSKGRLRYMACGPEGRMGISLQEKHVTDANRDFERLLRGDVVEVSEAEPRGDGLRLTERSEVRVVAPAGAPLTRPAAPGDGPLPEDPAGGAPTDS